MCCIFDIKGDFDFDFCPVCIFRGLNQLDSPNAYHIIWPASHRCSDTVKPEMLKQINECRALFMFLSDGSMNYEKLLPLLTNSFLAISFSRFLSGNLFPWDTVALTRPSTRAWRRGLQDMYVCTSARCWMTTRVSWVLGHTAQQ